MNLVNFIVLHCKFMAFYSMVLIELINLFIYLLILYLYIYNFCEFLKL